MNDRIIINWAGNRNSGRVWGYLTYCQDSDQPRPYVYYTFWGKMNGKLQFSKIFSYYYSFMGTKREKLKSYTYLPEDEMKKLNNSINEQFTEYLLLCKLKHESYR